MRNCCLQFKVVSPLPVVVSQPHLHTESFVSTGAMRGRQSYVFDQRIATSKLVSGGVMACHAAYFACAQGPIFLAAKQKYAKEDH
mmetsp:Transcript_59573/g.141753  ORF Transcript_59573/g.141753 Transcript_59573/m.141753 type:complete len:85 (+) Transcript_59573:226-480(+)